MAFNVRRRKRSALFSTDTNDFTISSKSTNQLQTNCFTVSLGILWICMICMLFLYVIPLAQRGVVFSSSTEETCQIISYQESDCKYDCHCKYVVDPNGEHQKFCKKCDGKQYVYTVIAASKCGEKSKLIQTKHEYGCPEKEFKVGEEIKCYVPHCNYETFTYHHHHKIIFEAVALSMICVGIIIYIPYHLHSEHRKKKLCLLKL